MIAKMYIINSNTLAILPGKHLDYDSIVIEKNRIIYVKKTPLQIIKASCIKNWATYDGRRRAVKHHMKYTQKLPIPISKVKQQYFFPTHSPKSIENSWIAARHIAFIMRKENRESKIQFKCGETVTLNVSEYILQQQKNKALACMYKLQETKGVDFSPFGAKN